PHAAAVTGPGRNRRVTRGALRGDRHDRDPQRGALKMLRSHSNEAGARSLGTIRMRFSGAYRLPACLSPSSRRRPERGHAADGKPPRLPFRAKLARRFWWSSPCDKDLTAGNKKAPFT